MKGKKYLQQLFVVLTIIIGINVWTGTSGEIDAKAADITQPAPVNQVFPDSKLAEIMRVRLGKTNVTDFVSQDELNMIEIVDTSYGPTSGVNSIEGIQYLNHLNTLILQGGNVSDIGPLSGLTSLTTLVISSHKLSDIRPLSNLTNLTILQINQNQISDISPLAGLINLTNLQINQNQISDISPLAGLTNLTSLNMAQNKIDNISSLSSLTSLWSLYMANNQISDISSLSNLTKLYRLMFENNQVNNISVLSHMADLSYIDASNNQISDLSSLKDLKNLSTISMTNQQIDNKPMIYQSSLVFVNNIKDNTGALVAPETISENGNYKSPNFTWNLPNYINQVSYTFNQEVTSSNGGIAFSGSVIQPLTQAPVLYNVIFDVDGEETSETIEVDSLLKAPADPTKDGYTFTGWYDSPTGGKKWDFKTDKMPANDIILYAQFSINQYTVTLVEDGRIISQRVDYEQSIQTPVEPTKEGYTFIGWYDAPTKGNQWDFEKDKMPANDITLYAQFRENTSSGITPPSHIDEKTTPSKTKGILKAKANHDATGSKVEKSNEQSSQLPATGDNSDFTVYLQVIGILFLLVFFWVRRSIARNKE
ncbi:internalin [Listeria monocytogenes]|uniref:Internalin n=1 Tax=Listeria monocytogenes TaxID=1639 RepID=A0A823JEJ2_LISMN|nr:InlB B-repeat-containing protein [Listeria monocytogenes]EAE5923245.1 internalin [Listeria monocytogenes]EAG6688872.1 internalin [Listeria monocytogenes]EAG9355008.1 internalin [Listeria monocytogenes]EHY61399.1 internalin P2 [Listeria monocytogenes FSL J1-208]QOF63872.1 InlB B-repeat-containing protein [Listeria monocytogenes FSL J1-208]